MTQEIQADFIPLATTQDGDFLSANKEARTRLRPYQTTGISMFWIERSGDVYGATRNLEFAGKRQEIIWAELLEKYSTEVAK